MKYGAVILAAGDVDKNPVSACSQRDSASSANQIFRQIDALAFIDQFCIVGKNKPAWLQTEYAKVVTPEPDNAGLPFYLDCARDFIDDFFYDDGQRLLVAYSNGPFIREHINQLLSCGRDISLAFYPADYDLRDARSAHAALSASAFQQRENGQNSSQIQEEALSLITLSSRGWIKWRETASKFGDKLEAVQMPEFLKAMAESGTSLNAMSIINEPDRRGQSK